MKKRICKCLHWRKWIQHTKSTCGWCLTRIWNLNAETFDSRIVSLIKSFLFFCTVLECVCVCCVLLCFFTPSAVGASVSRRAHAGAVLRGAGASVLTGAAVGAVRSPASFLTHTVAMHTCTKTHTHMQTHKDTHTFLFHARGREALFSTTKPLNEVKLTFRRGSQSFRCVT